MPDYTHKSLKDVHDSAPDFGFGEFGEARFAREAADAEQVGLAYHALKPDAHNPLGHVHEDAEEVYVVLAGSGRMKLDDEIIEIRQRDMIRVAPDVWRGFSAGPEGLEVIAFGAHHPGDGQLDPQWWVE